MYCVSICRSLLSKTIAQKDILLENLKQRKMKTKLEILLVTLIIGALTAIYSCSDDPEVTLSSEKDILSFSAPGQTGTATINASNLTVVAEVVYYLCFNGCGSVDQYSN